MEGKKYTYYLCFIIIMLMSLEMYSNNSSNPPLPKPDGPGGGGYPQLPIDGGLSYLFIVGAAYGVYAIRKRVKE